MRYTHKARVARYARLVLVVLCAFFGLHAVVTPARAEMPEVNITDAKMVQMPHFRFILPNSAIEMSVHQQVSSTTIDLASKYDILDSYFNIGFDIRYNFVPYFAGMGLSDEISVERDSNAYFQRLHILNPYFGYNLGKFTQVRTGILIEDTLSAPIGESVEIDRGRVIMESAGIRYNTLNPLKPAQKGALISCKLFGSFSVLGSDYEYTKGEIDIQNSYIPLRVDYMESEFKFYFPITTVSRPVSDVYFAGGYDVLRGYNYREFFGDTLMYAKLNYHMPLIKNVKKQSIRTSFNVVTIDLTGETARVGNLDDLSSVHSQKSSVSFGLGCDTTVFEHVNLKFNAFSGKALEPRDPVFYFILTAYTYFSI
ncbi:MAG: hypothetical protein A2297_08280 [Elusimicrobia bacterium RIFOXYB2_FULL_48_7]|nr:MAG: hypothetical protein A2297_08280 [Elusimicrobia bacterium RIFOXYB2_FULL_48_7]